MTADIITVPNRDVSHLYPVFADLVKKGVASANAAGYPIAVFEAYRSPGRQDWLYAQGRTRPGNVITQAKAWESAHQAGVAVDLALYKDGKWSWDFTAKQLHPFFVALGLETLSFEVAHVQMTGGLGGKLVGGLAKNLGLERTWETIQHAFDQRHLSGLQ